MIYNKDAAFSYPVLNESNGSYADSSFHFNLSNITDHPTAYELSFEYEIDSHFVSNLLNHNQAVLIFIIQSEDNLFIELNTDQKTLTIPKSRIAFSDKVRAQLHIQTKEDITYTDCDELNSFYDMLKDQISLPKFSLIGYSNVSTVRNTGTKGIPLFEQTVDPNMELEYQVILSNKSILLKFKENKHMLHTTARNRDILNIYLYNALEKALNQFIDEHMVVDEAALFLEDIDDSNLNDLQYKIYQLITKKGIDEISNDRIDELVQRIAPDIIGKFTRSIERLNDNGN